MLHVPDLTQALDLLTRVLRFKVLFRMDNYAFLDNSGAGLRILEECGRPAPAPGEKTRVTVYIDVSDVDALYSELLPELMTLPKGDVQAPRDQSWNQREFQVRLPDGQWLTYGQPIKPR